jgi:hypothetical protein
VVLGRIFREIETEQTVKLHRAPEIRHRNADCVQFGHAAKLLACVDAIQSVDHAKPFLQEIGEACRRLGQCAGMTPDAFRDPQRNGFRFCPDGATFFSHPLWVMRGR